jgi:tetratricopeptide (TPR) repeat protein
MHHEPSRYTPAGVIMAAIGLMNQMMKKCIGLLILMLWACVGMDAAPPRVILVFPLENMSGNASVGWMSEGIAELLSTRLASSTRYVLQRGERDDAYEQLGLPLEAPLTLASEYKVAQVLGATVAVVGQFTVVGGQLTTHVQWLNVPNLRLSDPIVVTGKLAELDVLETRLAWELLKSQDKDAVTGTEEEFGNRFASVRLDAFEGYIRGVLSTDSKTRVHFLQEADRLNPRDHRAAFALGRYYFEQKAYAESARWLRVVNSGDRNYADSLFLLGIDEYFLGHGAAAEIALKKLATMVPLGEVLNNLGVVELRLGHYEEALADFKQAFQKDPGDSDYAFNMSMALWRLKKYDQVAEYLHKILAQDPEDLDVHILLAQVSGELGDTETRQAQLTWVSEHEKAPDDDPPGDNNNAQAAPDPAPRIKDEYDGKAFHLLSLAITRAAQNKLDEQPAHVVQSDGQTHLKQGQTLLAAGRLPDAERELTQAVLLLPNSGEAHQALGQTYEREGKHTLAATEFETSLKEKDSFQAHLWLARTYASLDHLEPALEQAQAAQQMDPSSIEAKGVAEQIRAQLSVRRDKP